MQRLGLGLVVAGILGVGLGSARGAEGDQSWIELTTPHFRLYTDLTEGDARRVIGEFEATYAAFAQVAFAVNNLPPFATELVVFRSPREFEPFAPFKQAVGYFTSDRHDLGPRPTAVMSSALDRQSVELFQHELGHRFVYRFLLHPPNWLTEGLAELFSTLRLERGQVIIGEQPAKFRFYNSAAQATWINGLILSRLPSVEELLQATHEHFSDKDRGIYYYAGSWVLMHLLFNGPQGYRPKFIDYFAALAASKSHEEAWRSTLGPLGKEKLEKEYRRYVQRDFTNLLKERYTPPPPPLPTMRPLSQAEVHLLFATLRPWSPNKKEALAAVRADLEYALARAPDSPEAHFWVSRFQGSQKNAGDLGDSEVHLRRAIELKPREQRYWEALAQLQQDQLIAARQKGADTSALAAAFEESMGRLKSIASSPSTLEFVAEHLGRRGLLPQALAFAQRAIERDSACWQCLDTLAEILAQKGDLAGAVAAEQQAIALTPETLFRAPDGQPLYAKRYLPSGRVLTISLDAKLQQYRTALATRGQGGQGSGKAEAAPAASPSKGVAVEGTTGTDARDRQASQAPPGDGGAAGGAAGAATGEDLPEQLGREDIQRGMLAIRPIVTACYQREHRAGTAIVSLIIAPDGTVSSTEIRGVLAGTPTGACVTDAVRQARFPRIKGVPTTVTYPFIIQ